MQVPGFTADRSIQLPNGTYRTLSWHGDVRSAINPQFTPRPDRPPGEPQPFLRWDPGRLNRHFVTQIACASVD